MNKSSEEYNQFIEEYEKMLEHYARCSQYLTAIKTSKDPNTGVAAVYGKALQAHIDATKSYKNLLAIYKELLQKWLLVAQSYQEDDEFK
ncbi:hypothetical protein HW132_14535 [Brasilonema sp. CT11]|nr:hypothetical protein [Brasilonema sp. CT11]